MSMYDLSILIPARGEMFLAKTVENILENKRGRTEVIVGLDGEWAEPGVDDHPDVTIVYVSEPIGQRAMTNRLCKLSTAKYVMKVDAHCAFDEGFDTKLMADTQDDWTVVPTMKNLHAFDWVCKSGHRRYQGPSGACMECGEPTERDILWRAKPSPNSNSYCFDTSLKFRYFREYQKRQEGDLVETMSLQGSCFMLTRDKYHELNICDEEAGSWGHQGSEVALKTWLSGGRVIVNKKTWYAHMFRTQGGDFGFPWPAKDSKIEQSRRYIRDTFLEDKWPLAKHKLSWLIDKFSPVPGWGTNKGIIYYTDNQLDIKIAHRVQGQLKKIGLPIVSASLKPMPHFGTNIHLPLKRGIVTMYGQIIAALEISTADIVFFCEHDVLYHPSHFDFTPEKRDVFYYNVNVWKVRTEDGHALWVNNCRQVSGLCGYREELLKHYKERLAFSEMDDGLAHKIGYEPGTRQDWVHRGTGKTYGFRCKYISENWMSKFPNLDLRHDKNLTKNRWSPDEFHNRRNTEGWTETTVSEIPGW